MDEKVEEKKDTGLLDAFIVAAIDFGTTYSGYAFSFKHDYDKDPTQVDIIETALEAVNVFIYQLQSLWPYKFTTILKVSEYDKKILQSQIATT